jgi:hypothetical protein
VREQVPGHDPAVLIGGPCGRGPPAVHRNSPLMKRRFKSAKHNARRPGGTDLMRAGGQTARLGVPKEYHHGIGILIGGKQPLAGSSHRDVPRRGAFGGDVLHGFEPSIRSDGEHSDRIGAPIGTIEESAGRVD